MTDRYPHRLSNVDVDRIRKSLRYDIEPRLGDDQFAENANCPRAGRQSPSRVAPSRLSERPSTIAALLDDWHSFIGEVRSSPASHALVAIFTVIAWTALLVLPTMLGAWS